MLNSFCTINKLCLHHKGKTVIAVYGYHRPNCLFSESYETHRYTQIHNPGVF